ncbi:MAG: hypothetical protein ILO34_03865 [Kiritimatiellae bacterium]|nr:hypothetical protein [Kiritimatiellia bacterium]
MNILPIIAAIALTRPYELDLANRIADDHPALAPLTNAAPWRVECHAAEAWFETVEGKLLFGDGVCRLRHRATGKDPEVRLRLKEPALATEPFDTLSCWIYGNNHNYMKRADTPPVTVWADFEDSAGREMRIRLDHVHYKEWFKALAVLNAEERGRVKDGARFLGLAITGGTNTEERELFFNSFSVFADELRPLEFKPRAKRPARAFPGAPAGLNTGEGELPFPNRAKGIAPDTEPLAGLEFKLPESDTDWSELAFRLDGGEWQYFAVGGGVVFAKEGGSAKTRWTVDNRVLIAEVESDDEVDEVRFGAWKDAPERELIAIPYYTYCQWPVSERPSVVMTEAGGRPFFFAAHVDWTQSNASEPYAQTTHGTKSLVSANGGTRYFPKTDGRRNVCRERFVWIFSDVFEDVLPVVPNPESPWKTVAGSSVWRAHPAGDRERDIGYWRGVRKRGLKHMIVTDHETQWRDGNESFTFRTFTAPGKGGDEGQREYARAMTGELGFRYGPYNNFTDFAPVNGYWSADHVSRNRDGSFATAWDRCYAPKPAWAVGMCEKLAPEIQKKFGFNTAYCDVHTCVTPWSRVDYDARAPGAGTFAQTFYAFGEIMLIQKNCWNGPVYSEGGCHFMYCGLTDGNYAQDQTYVFHDNPWLVDFDLKRLHPLCCNFGMGNVEMFYAGLSGYVDGETDEEIDRFLAATLAFGHPGFLVHGEKYENRSYFMLQAIASLYTRAEAEQILYLGEDGTMYETSDALANGAYRRNQIVVRYSDGTIVVVNGSMDEKLSFGNLELPPNGYFAASEDESVFVFSGMRDGKRFDYSLSPEYEFSDTRGENGQKVRLREDGGEWPVASLADFAERSHFELAAPEKSGARIRFADMDPGRGAHTGVETSGGKTHTGLVLIPGAGGTAFAEYALEGGRLEFEVGKDDGEQAEAELSFTLEIDGRKAIEEKFADRGWRRFSVDLGEGRRRVKFTVAGAMAGVSQPRPRTSKR